MWLFVRCCPLTVYVCFHIKGSQLVALQWQSGGSTLGIGSLLSFHPHKLVCVLSIYAFRILMCRPTDALTHSLTTQGRANKARRFLSQTGEYFTGAMDEMIACYVKGVSRSNRLKQNHTARSLSFSQKQQEASRQTVSSYLVNLATHLAQSCPKSTCQKVSWHKLLPHYSSFLYSEHGGLRDYTGNQ